MNTTWIIVIAVAGLLYWGFKQYRQRVEEQRKRDQAKREETGSEEQEDDDNLT